MVDYNELRKKFPVKNAKKRNNIIAKKAIALEYERKKAELDGLKAPAFKKGIVFYAVVILGLLMLGSLVLSATGRGGRAPISRAHINAKKSVEALAIALGRYRYHVGSYPTTEQGLEQLASKIVTLKGWNGPYIRQVVLDPWGHEYVYASNGEAKNPTLYSRGPDGLAGTTDDILPDQSLFDEPFKDTSWLKGWMPQHLRGYVLAPDNCTKQALEKEVQNVLTNSTEQKIVINPIPQDVINRMTENQLKAFREMSDEMSWGTNDNSIRLISHWNHNENEKVKVKCEAKGDEVELFLNGESCGRIKPANGGMFSWNVTFDAGEIKVIAFKNNLAIGEVTKKTADTPVAIHLLSTKEALGDGELAFIKVSLIDNYGVRHPTASANIEVNLEGPGEVVSSRNIVDGCGIVIVRRLGGSGLPLKLTTRAKGLRQATITLPR